ATRNGDTESGLDDTAGNPCGPTPVVTVFLWQGQRILLALRSESVSTFPHHWAGISGYVEGDDPLERALVEIKEETNIPRESVTLSRVGSPILVDAPTHHRQFLVHPFLFAVDDGVEPRQDWEAARFEWVDLSDMQRRVRTPTVPQLYDAFERVWLPWPWRRALAANVELACQWLRHDRQMGAGTLARAAARELIKLLRLADSQPLAETIGPLRSVAERLRWTRPSMAALVNLLADATGAIDQSHSAHTAIDSIKRFILQSEEAESKVSLQAAERIAPGWKIMTISYSSTVLRTLLAAASKVARVYVCEGRPLMEGRQLAARLRTEGLAVTLLTDAQAFVTMPQIDAVLLGADSILPDGSAVNKVGSAQLALAAHHCHKLVVVAAERLKFVRDGAANDVELEVQPIAEVWPDAPDGIEVLNVYFEAVPARLINGIISEDGVVWEHAPASPPTS
ncbi:MAG: NUDIX domain-containing protein, partial [Candidatus Tectomicrobia bacterium]|nr:NUDIX domain-containing protein [Candidatus Tectomicrobia bacterium]